MGTLAVALGVGIGFATGMPGLAWADDTEPSSADASTPTASASTEAAESTPPPAEPTPTSTVTDSQQDSRSETPQPAEPGMVQSSGTVHTGSYGPNAEPEPEAPAETEDAPEPQLDETPPVATQSPAPQDDPIVEPTPEPTLEDSPVDAVVLDDDTDDHFSGTPKATSTPVVIDQPTEDPDPLRTESFSLDEEDVPAAAAFTEAPSLTAPPSLAAAPAPSPVQALLAIPIAVVDLATSFVAAVLTPFLAPSPAAPVQPPVLIFTVLDWVRREIQRTFFNQSPTAVDNAYTTSEGLDLEGNVLTDDTDADGDALTASLVAGPSHGTLVLDADGSFTYTPDDDYSGADTFTYKVYDAGLHLHGLLGFLSPDRGHSDVGSVAITVTPGGPTANDDTAVVDEDAYVDIDVLANDTNDDGATLSIVSYTQPANGAVGFNGGDGTLFYLGDGNFHGTDTFTYTVTDGGGADTATVTVTVNPVNDIASATGDDYSVTQNQTLTVAGPGVLANDTDVDGDPLTAVKFSDPIHGTLSLDADGSFTYTPDTDFFGADSFQYYVDDGTTPGGLAVVNITVDADLPNAAPVANYDSLATAVGTPLVFGADALLANDFDADDDPLTVTITLDPENGELVDNGDGTYTYTPDTGFAGTDVFEYAATDPSGDGSVAIVGINVGIPANSAPVAAPDLVSTRIDTPRVITPIELVGNDTDADDEVLAPYIVSGPAHGTLDIDDGGTFTYTPDPGFTGIDDFYYTAFDGYADSQPTLVTVQVVGQSNGNTAAVAGYDSLATPVGTVLIIDPNTLLTNDFDAQNDPLVVNVTQYPDHGTLDTDASGNLVYTPDDGFVGTDGFFYSAGYPENSSLPAEVTINVGIPANRAPFATPDRLVTQVGAPLTFDPQTLCNNDVDVDGDELTVYVISAPAHGELDENADGTYTYTPDSPYVGLDTFYYTAYDGQSDSIPTAVTIDVGGTQTNFPPITNDDALSTAVNTPLLIDGAFLLSNDVDPDGDSSLLTGNIIDFPTHGTLDLVSAVYTPDLDFEGVDSFTYRAFDYRNYGNLATVTITVGNPL